MQRSELYQLALIFFLVVTTILFGVFLFREVFPEYKVFQETYVDLEEFRSGITGEAPAPFAYGVKQIVLPQGLGPEIIDRCTTCHVALQLQHFSPTKLARDINGQVIHDANGTPVQVANEEYVWKLLDDKIAMLTQPGQDSDHLAEAERLKALKTTEIEDHEVDMTKVLAMHPLLGKETRPFEFHPIEEYGCTVCHNGNGRALTMEKAHGPVFDGRYEEAYEGPHPEFLELDPDNDPKFSKVFNHKPGHKLLFQTTPLYPGDLIQANCVQCHLTSLSQLQEAATTVEQLKSQTSSATEEITKAFADEKRSLLSLVKVKHDLDTNGYDQTVADLRKIVSDYTVPEVERRAAEAQISYLTKAGKDKALAKVRDDMAASLGGSELIEALEAALQDPKANADESLEAFIKEHTGSTGALFTKSQAAARQNNYLKHIDKADSSFQVSINKDQVRKAISSDIDRMTGCYQKGEELYISQACYACHRIAGFARGGVGPELTWEGNSYPWYVKESIVWPQADLRTSTMPNYKLDHEEVEALMCFLMAQKGKPASASQVEYSTAIKQWEEGKKQPWEKPVEPSQIHDVRFGMTVFATQGCAACHRLKGFESDVGFAVEKGEKEPTFDQLYKERTWFSTLFPEMVTGSEIVQILNENSEEIDRRIVDGIRTGSIIEELEANHPDAIESLYTPFKYALRAKNLEFEQKASSATTFDDKQALEKEQREWKERVHRVLKVFVQEYGLGRLIGPRPNWSGVYRSDEWLIEHFYNPGSHVARSIMPVFPFDETKFYALTYMLDTLAQKNAQSVREIWDNRGFNPELAFDIHCSQCHGTFRQGDGPIAEWLYPIPKNLRNTTFLLSLTRQRAIESIRNGVRGGPMPPWGEVAPDKPFPNKTPILKASEIDRLVDWLYMNLPKDVQDDSGPLKWRYQPEDVIRELDEEGDVLHGSLPVPRGSEYLAAVDPQPTFSDIQTRVREIFDIRPYPVEGVDRKAYYIKDKYFTHDNIAEGQRLFIENCAVCHGKEGAGNGLRAGTMVEAKPRMLTNLDWIATHDDLRLLQSIKYGVPGTSMVAWGDYTSTLQRLQLVTYIRSLSHEQLLRERMGHLLYQSFDKAAETVRLAKIDQYKRLKELEAEWQKAEQEKDDVDVKLATDKSAASQAVEAYQKQIELAEEVRKQEVVDAAVQDLINEIKKQRERYSILGITMLSKIGDTPLVENVIDLIGLNATYYHYKDGKLSIDSHSADPHEIIASGKQTLDILDAQIADQTKQEKALQGELPSAEKSERLKEIKHRKQSLEQAKNQLISTLEDSARSRKQQEQLLDHIDKAIQAVAQEPNDKTTKK
ncbi:MAG: c-type cytochrome [Chlamydiales bacterium]|nr:c-type cytochrome [Chlamydiales bacterium]